MIVTRNLSKRYGNSLALCDLNLTIEAGQIFGYIGPNGAGKTTTMKILATLLAPTAGSATVCGFQVGRESKQIRPLIGYMPDVFGVYDDMTVEEYLTFFAAAYGLRGEKRTRIVSDVLELTDLGSKRDTMVEALSRGMQQRLGLARTLVHDPKVLILDEPASGLDPRARIEMRALLKEIKRMGKTIMISSHILSELGEMCDSVGIIEKGRLLFSGTVAELAKKTQMGGTIEVSVADRMADAAAVLMAHPMVEGTVQEDDHMHVTLKAGADDYSFIPDLLVRNDFRLTLLRQEEVKLEDVFMKITKGIVS